MPIKIDPIEIEVEEVIKKTVTADKLHILKLTISDLTKGKPSIELQMVAYAEDANGDKQFGTAIQTLRTTDLYAAIANLAGVGLTKIQEAMEAVFGAAAELVQYQAARKSEAEGAMASFKKLQEEFLLLPKDADPEVVKSAREAVDLAMQEASKAQAAVNDPANPRIK